LHPASLHDRIYAQFLDGIVLGVVCSLWLYLVSGGELYFLWISPMIPQFLIQVPEHYFSVTADFWWGGAFVTVALPYGEVIFIQYPVPLFWLLYLLYYTYFGYRWGQTPGKIVKKVVILSEDGSPPGWEQSLLRWLGYVISILPLGLGFWIGLDRKEMRTWYDRWTKTRVLSYDPLSVEKSD